LPWHLRGSEGRPSRISSLVVNGVALAAASASTIAEQLDRPLVEMDFQSEDRAIRPA